MINCFHCIWQEECQQNSFMELMLFRRIFLMELGQSHFRYFAYCCRKVSFIPKIENGIQQLKKVAMTGAAAKQAVVELKKKNAALEKENAEMQKKIPSTMDRLLKKKNLELLETRNFNLRQENKELKEALEEERSFSDRLLEGIDRVLDMLERHLPKQLLHLVDKARDLLPEHQTYRQEKQHERGHSWGDMSL